MAKRIISKASSGREDGNSGNKHQHYRSKSVIQHPGSQVHPSTSEGNLPRMAYGGIGVGMSSQSEVNFAPNGGGTITLLKNKVLYHSRSDFRTQEREARV